METRDMKIVFHKPTLPPLKCEHCKKIWYGSFCDNKTHEIVPHNKTLCMSCYGALDNYLYNHRNQEYGKVDCTDFSRVWIEDSTKTPLPVKRKYTSSVPEWVRIAIESGEMLPNDEHVYTIMTCGNRIMYVHKTLDRSNLKKQRICY